MEQFISMYIDNELTLDEKKLFVEQVAADRRYREDVLDLLEQEKLLSGALIHDLPDLEMPAMKRSNTLHTFGLGLAACVVLCFSFFAGSFFSQTAEQPAGNSVAVLTPAAAPHRFVIYQQGSAQVEITGSFTGWQKVALTPSGSTGYWEVTLPVGSGEHRYAFIIDGKRLVPDPTVDIQEADDFGAINSILVMERKA